MSLPHGQLTPLTGLRFFAAWAVVLFHYGYLAPLPWILFLQGRQTVGLFFILSGIVLTYSYGGAVANRSLSWKAFMQRRLGRLMPMHVIALVLATVVFWHSERQSSGIAGWVASLLCVQVWWPSATIALHWNPPSWSVSCELFFYSLFPVLLLILNRWCSSRRRIVAAIVLTYVAECVLYAGLANLIQFSIGTSGELLGFTNVPKALANLVPLVPVLRLGEFIIGVCIGLLLLSAGDGRLAASRRLREAVLWCSLGLIVLLTHVDLKELGNVVEGARHFLLFIPLFIALLLALASGPTLAGKLLTTRLVLLLGHSSYSLYLLHYPIGALLLKSGSPPHYATAVAVSIAASVMAYRWIEAPLTRRFRVNSCKPAISSAVTARQYTSSI